MWNQFIKCQFVYNSWWNQFPSKDERKFMYAFSLLLSHCRRYSKRKKPKRAILPVSSIFQVNDLSIMNIKVEKSKIFQLLCIRPALRPVAFWQLPECLFTDIWNDLNLLPYDSGALKVPLPFLLRQWHTALSATSATSAKQLLMITVTAPGLVTPWLLVTVTWWSLANDHSYNPGLSNVLIVSKCAGR